MGSKQPSAGYMSRPLVKAEVQSTAVKKDREPAIRGSSGWGAELRKLIDVPRVSFESMMRKRAHTALAMFSGRSADVQPRWAPPTLRE
jgi:hypothetical protein